MVSGEMTQYQCTVTFSECRRKIKGNIDFCFGYFNLQGENLGSQGKVPISWQLFLYFV